MNYSFYIGILKTILISILSLTESGCEIVHKMANSLLNYRNDKSAITWNSFIESLKRIMLGYQFHN